ncbi:MAG: M28 family peptidase [Planctomycetota bacterium]
MTPSLGTLLLLLAPTQAGPPPAAPTPNDPPARGLSRKLTAQPRLASTEGGMAAARFVAMTLAKAGFEVELDERIVCLSLPRRIELALFAADSKEPWVHRVETYDAGASNPGDVPRYSAWSTSDSVRAEVFEAGRGLRADYERMRAEGVEFEDRIALVKYGGAYRGVKAELAAEYGCAGVLLYSDPASDGYARGPAWPEGPWKPGDAAQRGAISALTRAPGDPTTPGWPSPRLGEEGRRLSDDERDARLPTLPCLPIGGEEAVQIRRRLRSGEAVEARLDLDIPRDNHLIVNVIARLEGEEPGFVVAGNHRDAWVRGAHDAGSGTVALLRAAQRLGARARAGWKPRYGIVLGFWDAEEFGLIGSTEWAEAYADELRDEAIAYVNADAAVSGTRFRASAAPGLLATLRAALERVPDPAADSGTVWDQWAGAGTPRPGLPGSGSDYTVFLHHLSIPVVDISLSGNSGGQYHTRFDDFELMERFLDPGWVGHEAAGHLLEELLVELDARGFAALDNGAAVRELAGLVRGAYEADWLPEPPARRLGQAFESLAAAADARAEAASPVDAGTPRLYPALAAPLADRPWYRNRLWAPGLETGYAAETLPALRTAAAEGGEALAKEVESLAQALLALGSAWRGE